MYIACDEEMAGLQEQIDKAYENIDNLQTELDQAPTGEVDD